MTKEDAYERTEKLLEDLKTVGIMKEGESEEGERTWYLSETGVKWAEGEISLDLEELAEEHEEELHFGSKSLKEAEALLHQQNLE